MQIDTVDYFYLAMPEVALEGDGSQDALPVRGSAGGFVGGEENARRHRWSRSPPGSVRGPMAPASLSSPRS